MVRVLGHPGRLQEEINSLDLDALLESLEGGKVKRRPIDSICHSIFAVNSQT